MNIDYVGKQIGTLRKQKGLTQNELGERLGVSFQAVSKWERGETLPDTALLPQLADILETSVDNILRGSEWTNKFCRRMSIAQVREAIECFTRIGELLGCDNNFYTGAIEGVDNKMQLDMHSYLQDPYTKEALIAEATMQCIRNGAYVDLSDIQKGFDNQHWRDIVSNHARKYGVV